MPRALITGANRGLGLGFARVFAARGYDVIGCVRDAGAAGRLAEAVKGQGRALGLLEVDISDLDAVRGLKARLNGAQLDAVVSNAALTGGELGRFGDFDVDRFMTACRINAAAPMVLAEAAADALSAAGGVFCAVSSRLGAVPFYGYAEYFASKTALNMLVKQMSIPLGERGVTAFAVHPGWVQTEATAEQGQAPLQPDEAAALIVDIIEDREKERSGRFFDPDGSELPIVPQQFEVKFYSKPKTATR